MNAPASLPENIRSDISIYLAPDEKILKALSPFSPSTQAAGQVWLILTSQSVIFHTRENKKEPLVALLSRKDIKEIEYFQRPGGVQLTFIPTGNTQKVSRLNFGVEKLEELEDFCEDLADYINFKKETAAGVKTFSAPPAQTTQSHSTAASAAGNRTTKKIEEESEIRHATTSIRHADKPEPTARPSANTSSDRPATEEPVKDQRPTPKQPPSPPEVKIVKPSPAAVPSAPPGYETATAASNGEFKASYVVMATLVSLLVAFIWYRFFVMIADWKNGGQR